MKIARQFHWEMGHRLPFHTGGCANIHGHSYKLWVEIEGETDSHGMLMDYGDMKNAVMPVIETIDHSFLCDTHDSVMKDFLDSTGLKVVYVPFTTTAEHIVAHLLNLLVPVFSAYDNVHGLRLRLQETEISFAEASKTFLPDRSTA